jgi:hypothetical protein
VVQKGNIRGYYWRVVLPTIARHFGEERFRQTHRHLVAAFTALGPSPTSRATHWWCRDEFLPIGDDPSAPLGGNGMSTKAAVLPRLEFEEFVRRVVIWARVEGIEVAPSWHEDDGDL